jgi:hypothetical protein
MNKYYANELLAGASARAVIVASQLASGREPSLTEFAKMETAGGEFDNENIAKFSDGFGIKVSKVKKAVCENLIKDTEGTDIGIETEAGGEVTCGDENEFYITFANMGVVGGSDDENVNMKSYVCQVNPNNGMEALFDSNGSYIGNCDCKLRDTVVVKGSVQEAVSALCNVSGSCNSVEFSSDFGLCASCEGYFWYSGASVCLPCSYPSSSISTTKEFCDMCGDQRVLVEDPSTDPINGEQYQYPNYGFCDLVS